MFAQQLLAGMVRISWEPWGKLEKGIPVSHSSVGPRQVHGLLSRAGTAYRAMGLGPGPGKGAGHWTQDLGNSRGEVAFIICDVVCHLEHLSL